MRWNRRFASWMGSQQICSNCATLSCYYQTKPLRSIYIHINVYSNSEMTSKIHPLKMYFQVSETQQKSYVQQINSQQKKKCKIHIVMILISVDSINDVLEDVSVSYLLVPLSLKNIIITVRHIHIYTVWRTDPPQNSVLLIIQLRIILSLLSYLYS